MQPVSPLAIGPLRSFQAVARRLSFRAAAEEMHVTQPAISRQIKSLEDELGTALFLRGTRHVEITSAGQQLLRSVDPLLARLDNTVRQIRSSQQRQPVGVTTFASLASLWLLPRLQQFQAMHPGVDIRISAGDAMVDLDDPEIDLALRYCHPSDAPAGSERLFGEVLTPVASPALLKSVPLRKPADLLRHTLLEEDDQRPSAEYLSWRHWLDLKAAPGLQPKGWVYLNYTYQQIQAALVGQGVALARVAMVGESIQRGELVEPFGEAGRISSPFAYWLVRWPGRQNRPALEQFEQWLLEQAAATRAAVQAVHSA
ncbi:MAG: LysR substrate-binding domain-containing protein [Rubrivivax sp.]|nr:LysR substrate-binding domain-containing protein [Rubrivivax sp.]